MLGIEIYDHIVQYMRFDVLQICIKVLYNLEFSQQGNIECYDAKQKTIIAHLYKILHAFIGQQLRDEIYFYITSHFNKIIPIFHLSIYFRKFKTIIFRQYRNFHFQQFVIKLLLLKSCMSIGSWIIRVRDQIVLPQFFCSSQGGRKFLPWEKIVIVIYIHPFLIVNFLESVHGRQSSTWQFFVQSFQNYLSRDYYYQ
eukprot:TRINITY_DN2147_c0_g1_i14.p1 TRINITY_DN2147_c0_g1~~TRINITY_DN2147_c0_g1_i14.p1  ORF type:complete len:197 (-),score=-22.69 TRINITY_DN2147_c0_g1_i14:64-654(-)